MLGVENDVGWLLEMLCGLRMFFHRSRLEPVEHLCHPCPADAEIAGKCRTAFELAAIEEGLIITGKTKGITNRFLWRRWSRFDGAYGVPR